MVVPSLAGVPPPIELSCFHHKIHGGTEEVHLQLASLKHFLLRAVIKTTRVAIFSFFFQFILYFSWLHVNINKDSKTAFS